MTVWRCLDCNVSISSVQADSGRTQITRALHVLAGHRTQITGSDRNRPQIQ